MPTRRDVFVNNNIYHIFNKTIAPFKSFHYKPYAHKFVDIFSYYTLKRVIPYSKYLRLNDKQKMMLPQVDKPYVEILAYCLMPNHYHFQLKQIETNGIHIFMSNIVNAFTRYYNILNERKGPLFLPVFRSQFIYSVEQLLHTSRYIHLNPVKDRLVKNFADLRNYKYSSFHEYATTPILCNTDIVMHYFDNDSSRYTNFLENDVEHQKVLAHIKKLNNKKQFAIFSGNSYKRRPF